MKMKLNKKIALASATVFSAMPFVATHADELTAKWTPRSVDEIKADITSKGNQQTYTVQYGDTLSTIAEALNVDVNVLANLNNIANLDLIFPDTVLKTEVNAQNEVTSVEIQTPTDSPAEAPTTAKADLTTNEVKVDDQTVAVDDLTKPVEETNTQPVPTTPQAPAEAPKSEEKPAQPEAQAPAAEPTATKKEEAPVVETADKAPATPATEQPTTDASQTPAVAEKTPAVPQEAPAITEDTSAAPTTTDQTYSAPATQTSPDFATLAAQNAANAGLQPKAAAESAKTNLVAQVQAASTTATTTETAAPVATAQTSIANQSATDVTPAVQQVTASATTTQAQATTVSTSSTASTAASNSSSANTYPIGECTWGAKALAPWAGNYWGNGGQWAASASAAGFRVGSTPAVGAIAVWNDGGYGHVAVVTAVESDTRIQVSESNYNGNRTIGNYRGWFNPTSGWGSLSYIYPN